MNVIRPFPLNNGLNSQRNNKIGQLINASNIIAGDGINIDYGTKGAIISVVGDTNIERMVYQGQYDFDLEYIPGDVVDIYYNQSFLDQNNNTIPFGSTTVSGYSQVPTTVGSFVCVQYVPPSFCNSAFVTEQILPQFTTVPQRYINGTRYYDNNIYYPHYPSIPIQYTGSATVLNGQGKITTNDVFWDPIGIPAIPMNICINNVNTLFYISAIQSGSLFSTSYLPDQSVL